MIWVSAALGLALGSLDFWGLRAFAMSLGRRNSPGMTLLLLLFLTFKLAILAAALYFFKDQAWFQVWAFALGLGLPFLTYFILEARKYAFSR